MQVIAPKPDNPAIPEKTKVVDAIPLSGLPDLHTCNMTRAIVLERQGLIGTIIRKWIYTRQSVTNDTNEAKQYDRTDKKYQHTLHWFPTLLTQQALYLTAIHCR